MSVLILGIYFGHSFTVITVKNPIMCYHTEPVLGHSGNNQR